MGVILFSLCALSMANRKKENYIIKKNSHQNVAHRDISNSVTIDPSRNSNLVYEELDDVVCFYFKFQPGSNKKSDRQFQCLHKTQK